MGGRRKLWLQKQRDRRMEWTDGRIIVSGKQTQKFSQATKFEVVFVFNQSAPLIWHSLLVAAPTQPSNRYISMLLGREHGVIYLEIESFMIWWYCEISISHPSRDKHNPHNNTNNNIIISTIYSNKQIGKLDIYWFIIVTLLNTLQRKF